MQIISPVEKVNCCSLTMSRVIAITSYFMYRVTLQLINIQTHRQEIQENFSETQNQDPFFHKISR